MLIVLWWYLLIGFAFGCFVVYAIVQQQGWEALHEEFEYAEDELVDIDVFKILFCVAGVLFMALIWPFAVTYKIIQR